MSPSEADRPGRRGRRAARPLPRRAPGLARRRRAGGRGGCDRRRPVPAEEPPPGGRRAGRAGRGSRASAAEPRGRRRGSSGRTSTWPSSTSRRASSSTREPGTPTGTLVHALAGTVAGGEPERPGIVHRLDRDTSGLLVVARSEEAHRRLSNLVRRRGLERTYLALVRGRPASRSGRIEAPIGRDRDDPTRISLDTDSPRDAVTHFESPEPWTRTHCSSVRLETGRMHQIRVHLAAIDLPVVGDAVYGVPEPASRPAVPACSTACVPAPVHRRADRDRLAAPAGAPAVPRRPRLEPAVPGTIAATFDPRPGGGSRWTVAGSSAGPAETPPAEHQPKPRKGVLLCPLSP